MQNLNINFFLARISQTTDFMKKNYNVDVRETCSTIHHMIRLFSNKIFLSRYAYLWKYKYLEKKADELELIQTHPIPPEPTRSDSNQPGPIRKDPS